MIDCQKRRGKLRKIVDQKMEEIVTLIKQQPGKRLEENKGFKKRDMSTVECFKCHEFGHYARSCEAKDENASPGTEQTEQENWD